jgi:hypothetical protein
MCSAAGAGISGGEVWDCGLIDLAGEGRFVQGDETFEIMSERQCSPMSSIRFL